MTIVTDYLLDVSAGGGLEARVGRHCDVMSDQPGASPDHHQPLGQQQKQQVAREDEASVRTKPSLGDEPSPCSSNPTSPTPEGTATVTAVPSRRALKNEDSSYDSDFESSEVLGPASTASGPEDTPGAEEQHDNVTRTVSDTLAAEFAEYVTMQPNTSTTPVLPTATSKTIVTTHEVTTTTSCSSSASVALSVPTTLIASSSVSQMPTKSGDSKDTLVNTSIKDSSLVSKKESIETTLSSVAKSDTETRTVAVKCPLTATASLPSHSLLMSKNSSSSGVTIRPHVSIASSVCSRPSSAPVTQSLVRSASAAVTSSEASTTSSGQSWSGSDTSVYSQQVEFGIKLGYSESLVQLALKKLGDKPAKNELLDELIRLGAVMPKGECELDGPLPTPSEGEEAKEADPSLALRPIIIDGSNVAMSHGDKNVFSCRGLRVCVEWFRDRGHKNIIVFVPAWRKESSRWDAQITDQQVMDELEQQKVLVFTPSRTGHTGGRRIIPYDDRYILNEAVLLGGVVVSNDNFRDLAGESAAFRRVVEEALLMYSWVNGRFVPPDDPLGRNGPTLDAFLRRPVPNTPQARDLGLCPYGKKCTYGNKCKYQHPERGTLPIKSVTERLQEHREKHYLDKATKSRDSSPGETFRGNFSLPGGSTPAVSSAADRGPANGKKPLQRTLSTHATSSAMSLPAALLHETPRDSRSTPTPGSPSSPGPGTSSATTASTPAGGPLLAQQHMMLSAQASYDQTKLQQQQQQQSCSHDAFKSQMFKSESCLCPLFTSQPHQLQQQPQHLHHQASGQQQPQPLVPTKHGVQSYQQAVPQGGWSYMRSQEGCEGGGNVFGEHVIVERHASDPESAVTSDNAHPKLRRQLTLNPSNDHRLAKMTKDPTHQKSLPIGHFGALQQTVPPQYQQLHGMNMPGNQHYMSQQQYQGSSIPPFSSYSSDPKLLQQNPQSQASSSGTASQPSHPSHLFHHQHHPQQHQQQQQQQPQHHHHQPQQATHPHVARFSSAPDPIGGNTSACNISTQYGHVPAGITRLNSTSDPHLNLYGSAEPPHYLSEPYEEVAPCRTPYFATHHSITGGQNPASQTPVGSRPLSPQQPLLQQQPRNLAMQSTVASVLNTSFPPPKSTGKQEERTRLYYHLINLFPEEIVLAALAKHPNETDVRKICSSILGFSGSDTSASTGQQHPLGPVSQQLPPSLLPSQQQSPSLGRPHLTSCQSVPLPIRVPSPSDSQTSSIPFTPAMAMPHENSRLREYMNPQASFMDADGSLRSLVSPMTSLASGGVTLPQQQLQQQQQPPPGQHGMHFTSQSHDAT